MKKRWRIIAVVMAVMLALMTAACGEVDETRSAPGAGTSQMIDLATGSGEAVTVSDADDTESGKEASASVEGGTKIKTDNEASSFSEAGGKEKADKEASASTEAGGKAEAVGKASEVTDTETVADELIARDGVYTSREDVALYIHIYGDLPDNFITKAEAGKLGWSGGSLEKYAPGKCIGGDRYYNFEMLLPTDDKYRECDIDTLGKKNRGAKRIIYSDEGFIYYTGDHYKSFELMYEP